MENKKSNNKVIIGILLLIFGAVLLAQNFNIIDIAISQYIFQWQSILIFIGIFAIARKPRRFTGYVLIVLGTIFWMPELLSVDSHLIIWPAMLIGAGSLVLFKGFFKSTHNNRQHAFSHCVGEDCEIKITPREH